MKKATTVSKAAAAKVTRGQALAAEEAGRKAQLANDGKALLGELAQAEAEAKAAADRAAGVRARLDALEAGRRALDAKPDLRPVTEEPAGFLVPVIRRFPGDGFVYDAGALVDPDAIPNFELLQGGRLKSFGTAMHPKAVVARGVVCGVCKVTYRSEPEGAAHFKNQHGTAAVERAAAVKEREARDEAEAERYRAESADKEAPARSWGRERTAELQRVANGRNLGPGDPIDRSAIDARLQRMKDRVNGPNGDIPPAAA